MNVSKILLSIVFLLLSAPFNYAQTSNQSDYPPAPAKILDAEIALTVGVVVRVRDFASRTVAVLLVETWSGPAVKQAEFLRGLKESATLGNVEFIGVSFEIDKRNKKNFRRLADNLNYRLGWGAPVLRDEIFKLSRFAGNPQVLVIHDGRLRGVFLGGHRKVSEALERLLREIATVP